MKKKKHNYKKKFIKRKPEIVRGLISMSSSGYGFLAVEGVERDFFVPEPFIGSAMDRDEVEAELAPDRKSDGQIAKVTKILKRGRGSICGVLLAGSKLRPFSKKISYDINVKGNLANARKGDWIEVELDNDDDARSARLVKVIGKAGDIQDDISVIASEYGLPQPYSAQDELEATALLPSSLISREHFDGRVIVTVDPADAKDFDDAVSVELLANGNYELGVHIADVSAWILRGEKFDAEAFERSFTSYLPGRTLPMLPKNLTKKISLMPGKKSFAHSIVMELSGRTAKVLSSRRFHSEISITTRLSFDDVEFFIENGRLPENFDDFKDKSLVAESLSRALHLYRMMRAFRYQEEEFLELETEFVRALCDEGGSSVKLLKKEVQREAEKLVEEFMLAANVEAAKEMLTKSIPGLFRVHPSPFPEKSVEFCDFVKLICGFSPGDISSRKVCNKFLKNMPEDHRKTVLTDAFLRALARAFYSEKNALHFGLGKTQYSHFTSPIRRYPDLLVHQQFLAFDGIGKLRTKKDIARIAIHCSEKEALNDESFWAANDRLKLHFLKDKILNAEGLLFDAVISKITKFGLAITIMELGIRGEIPNEFLISSGSSRKKTNPKIKHVSNAHRCGDFITVRLANVDIMKGKAIFQLA